MAGLGFKDFAVGEVLTSADVDGYLMQQSVMRFADAGARGSALGTATGTAVPLAEGMAAYLDDVAGRGAVQYYDGTAWAPVAGVLQVLGALKTDWQTGSGTTWTDLTSLSVTITPSSSTSRILCLVGVGVLAGSEAESANVRLLRDATIVAQGDASGSRTRTAMGMRSPNAFTSYAGAGLMFIDSPATTSATTYKMQANGSSAWAVNGPSSSTSSATYPLGVSTLVVMELA